MVVLVKCNLQSIVLFVHLFVVILRQCIITLLTHSYSDQCILPIIRIGPSLLLADVISYIRV